MSTSQPTLFMVKIGATPEGRLIEQHDIFFGVADNIKQLIPAIDAHWAEVAGKWHFDAYRAVTKVDGYKIEWLADEQLNETNESALKLFFINFGGYLPNQFEEYHHKLLVVAETQAQAVKIAKQSEFYQQYSIDEKMVDGNVVAVPTSHVDDKMSVDVDDIYDVNGLLASGQLNITPIAEGEHLAEDKQIIGYISLKKMK